MKSDLKKKKGADLDFFIASRLGTNNVSNLYEEQSNQQIVKIQHRLVNKTSLSDINAEDTSDISINHPIIHRENITSNRYMVMVNRLVAIAF